MKLCPRTPLPLLPLSLALVLSLCSSAAFTATPSPAKPPLTNEPPANWSFPIANLATLTPSAADVLTAPIAVTGDLTIAKSPPVIRFGVLPGQWPGASLWSAWGDSLFGSDTNFYCSIGDHAAPHGYAYVYRVSPASGEIKMIVDVNRVLQAPLADYAPGKIHAPLMEHDGWLLFAGYRGGKGVDDAHHYLGDDLIRWELATGKTERHPPPAPYCSLAASAIHKPSNRIYGVGPGGARHEGKSQFFVYDLIKSANGTLDMTPRIG